MEKREVLLMILYCSYFGKQTTPKVINNFFDEVASKSPLPIVRELPHYHSYEAQCS